MSEQAHFFALAALVERHADGVRAEGDRLARATDTCDWDGVAARRFRAEARRVFAVMRMAAARLDDIAAALRQHAVRLPAELAEQRRAMDRAAREVAHAIGAR